MAESIDDGGARRRRSNEPRDRLVRREPRATNRASLSGEPRVPKGIKVERRFAGFGACDYRTSPRAVDHLELVVVPCRGRARRVLLLGMMACALTCLWRERVAFATTVPWFIPAAFYFVRKGQIIRIEDETLFVRRAGFRGRALRSVPLREVTHVDACELWEGAHTIVVTTRTGPVELTCELIDGAQARFIQRELQATLRVGSTSSRPVPHRRSA